MITLSAEFFLFSSVALLFLLIDIVFLVWFWKLKKKAKMFFEGKKIKDVEDVLTNQMQKTKKLEAECVNLQNKANSQASISEKTFQKIGVVRFNPFSDMGGNQSFAVTLLDQKNNGVILSSLFIKEGNRVYAKSIRAGESDYPLSKEEKESLEKAINGQKK